MIEINAESLEWAYKKLKTYIYYYHSSNYLKSKIIGFENRLSKNSKLFEQITDNINSFLLYDGNKFWNYFNYDYIVYPKKNSFVMNDGVPFIEKERTNYFIDLDISIYLVDIIFTLELIDYLRSHHLFTDYSYGGNVDPRLLKSDDMLHNRFLFEDYKIGYKKWLNIPLPQNVSNTNDDIYIIRADLKSCFYSIKFNFSTLISEFGIKKSSSAKVMRNVYNLYTAIIKDKTLDSDKIPQVVILPIGLPSAQVLVNYLLRDLDLAISSSDNYVNYGRYIDDLLIVMKGKPVGKTFSDKLINSLPHVFELNDKDIKIRKIDFLRQKLSLNHDKTLIKQFIPKTTILEEEIFSPDTVSFCDVFDIDRENSPAFFHKELKSGDLRNILYDTLLEANDNAFFLIMDSDSATILNCFSFWTDIFSKYKNSNDKILKLEEKIKGAIGEIILPDNDNCLIRLKLCLKNELLAAKRLTKDIEDICFFGQINQDQMFCLIEKVDKGEYKYPPMFFTYGDVSLYLSSTRMTLSKNFIDDVNRLYNKLNDIIIDGGIFNNFELSCDGKIWFFNKTSKKKTTIKKTKKEKDVIVALGAINMTGLEESDLLFKSPDGYDLDAIIKIIKTAYRNKAKYLLLPEFTLEFEWLSKIIKEAQKRSLTIVSGIIHHKTTHGVVNYTLLYEHNSGLAFLRPKNYLSIYEKELIAYRGPSGMGLNYYEPNEEDKCYIVVNDGVLRYSFMTCYELTNIKDRSLLAGIINVLFVPVYNYDTEYFSNIINSYARDISCYVLQANSNTMGDTKIRVPSQDFLADITKVKGGTNNYCVVGTINVDKLKKANEECINKLKDILSGTVEPKNNKKEREIKDLSAGNHHCD